MNVDFGIIVFHRYLIIEINSEWRTNGKKIGCEQTRWFVKKISIVLFKWKLITDDAAYAPTPFSYATSFCFTRFLICLTSSSYKCIIVVNSRPIIERILRFLFLCILLLHLHTIYVYIVSWFTTREVSSSLFLLHCLHLSIRDTSTTDTHSHL